MTNKFLLKTAGALLAGVGLLSYIGQMTNKYCNADVNQTRTYTNNYTTENKTTTNPTNQGDLENKLNDVETQIKAIPRIQMPPSTCVRKPRIVLDPGHGMGNRGTRYDPGAVAKDANGCEVKDGDGKPIYEANVVLAQAKRIKPILEARGYEVYLTREDANTPTSLNSRVPYANNVKGDLFVSLHMNAAAAIRDPNTPKKTTNPEVRGVEVLCTSSAESLGLAKLSEKLILKYVNAIPGQEAISRGVHIRPTDSKSRNRLAVLCGNMPSILIESGFVTNTSGVDNYGQDLRYLGAPSRAAELGIVDAIDYSMRTQIIPKINSKESKK